MTVVEFSKYVRRPFIVNGVQITSENIAELAQYIGELRTEQDGSQYILADRRLVPNATRVYPGDFMTRMGRNVRCFPKHIFVEQFTDYSEQIQPWIDFMNKTGPPASQE